MNKIKILVPLVALIITSFVYLNIQPPSPMDNRVGLTDMRDFISTDPSGLHTGENLTYSTKNAILDHLQMACAEEWCNGDWIIQFENITCYKSKSACFLEMTFVHHEDEKNVNRKTCSIIYPHNNYVSFFSQLGLQATLEVKFYDLVAECINLSIKSIQ